MKRGRFASWICWAVCLQLKTLVSGTSRHLNTSLCSAEVGQSHVAAMWGGGTNVLSVPVAPQCI